MGAGSRIVLRNTLRDKAGSYDLPGDARAGLTSSPRTLPSKYFYDARGSHLFETITRLPEYYLTRAETEILERHQIAGRHVARAEALSRRAWLAVLRVEMHDLVVVDE